MKKILFLIMVYSGFNTAYTQNYITGPMAVYGPQYNAATTLAANGHVLVGSNGNWVFAGKISSIDKVTTKAPTSAGRAQRITFSGTGRYSGTALIDGYAEATGKAVAFVLPVGNATTTYPITAPAGAAFVAAYFDGSGTNQTITINGNSAVVYSPYVDVPSGIPVGNYSFSYPAGMQTATSSMLLSRVDNITYTLLAKVANFQTTGGVTSANITTPNVTQTFFATSNAILPVNIISFAALADGCAAKLAWQTASESNSNSYEIESSFDGINFAKVGTIASKNSATGSTYNYTYNTLSSGNTYFRLKVLDNDRSFIYSQIVAVTGTNACSTSTPITIWPNPTVDKINIQGVVIGSHITLTNINGQRLAEITGNGGSQTISLNNYANGVYFLIIQGVDGSIRTQKVIKD